MKATELMIGDLVYLVTDYFRDSSRIKREEILKIDALDLHRISDGLLEVEHIPPTHEILEKNGWVRRKIGDAKWVAIYECEGMPYIWEDINGNLSTLIGFTDAQIESVHQLQNILRSSGITEAADNFKV